MMDLSEFVDDCLTEILVGIKKAQAKEGGNNAVAALGNHDPRGMLMPAEHGIFTAVDFDVSVVAETKANGKAGIKVWSVGAEAGASHGSQHTSRVKFTIPLRLPEGDQSRAEKQKANFGRDLARAGGSWMSS